MAVVCMCQHNLPIEEFKASYVMSHESFAFGHKPCLFSAVEGNLYSEQRGRDGRTFDSFFTDKYVTCISISFEGKIPPTPTSSSLFPGSV